jgi:protein ImuA
MAVGAAQTFFKILFEIAKIFSNFIVPLHSEMVNDKRHIISKLQKDILQWEGFVPGQATDAERFGLGMIENAFPNGVFPTGTIHEFLTPTPETAAASGGFIGGLLGRLMHNEGICVWTAVSRKVFPPALKRFGVDPGRVIFIDVKNEQDALWVTEEALKCEGLSAVVAELQELSFAQSRRLQLAVEKSRVTGFILRSDLKKLCTTTCVARWQIEPIPSKTEEGMPGVGFPRWQVELLKVRNGKPGMFRLGWSPGGFVPIDEPVSEMPAPVSIRKIV